MWTFSQSTCSELSLHTEQRRSRMIRASPTDTQNGDLRESSPSFTGFLGRGPRCAQSSMNASCGETPCPASKPGTAPLPHPATSDRHETAHSLSYENARHAGTRTNLRTHDSSGCVRFTQPVYSLVHCRSVVNAHLGGASPLPHTSGSVPERCCRKKRRLPAHLTRLLPPSMMHNACQHVH